MYLKCKVCGFEQPVTTADEADEDLRTQGIRRSFRAEHINKCGEWSVSLVIPAGQPGGSVETDGVLAWADKIPHPDDVIPQNDGTFRKVITRDGEQFNVIVCEDCWQAIPRYVNFPFGLVSPESDGDAAGNGAKLRRISMDTNVPSAGAEHLPKVVCLTCYMAAFSRVYPDAPPPPMVGDVVGDGEPVTPPPPPPEEHAPDPFKELM